LRIRTIGVVAAEDRPPAGVDEIRQVSSYLAGDELIAAARSAGADAIHPGYGFLAENPRFAEAVIKSGLIWVGPPPTAISLMGDKAAARQTAADLSVPVVPGYDGAQDDDTTLAVQAERIGYPVLVKPAAGGGGKGMRVVREAESLPDALVSARREAERAFGDYRLILERYLEGSRHVEIQVLFDQAGHGIHLGERDCSAQRRNQKIIEESPAPSVSEELRQRIGQAALRLTAGVGYVGAGTVEFLLTDSGESFFLEMNTRLQVEHTVTEAVTGRDLVEDQLSIAEGRPLAAEQRDVRLRGHAIEARLYAEDPEHGFLPAAGRIVDLRWPDGAGIRVDAGVRVGDLVSDQYDPMLAKVIANGTTRAEALARLRHALLETRVLGLTTNLRFLRWLLDQPVARRGEIRTDTIEQMSLPVPAAPTEEVWRGAGRALLARGPYGAGPWGGGWRPNSPAAVRVACGDEERRVELADDVYDAGVALVVEGGVAYADVDGQSVEFRLAMPPSIEEAVRHAATAEGHAALIAPMPGRVIAIRAREGDSVPEHAAIIIIEAMKMEHAVTAPLAGTLSRLLIREGQQVMRGDVLAEISA
jgi:acetyl-CoA/propionyl-CoA carboxylase biotin carboxyl carrier protein